MKLFLFINVLFLSFTAFANTKVICEIDMPCGWLEPIPDVTENHLGFCVDRIEGNENLLTVFRSDEKGNSLPGFELIVSALSTERIAAANDEASITLNASQYGDLLAGGLLFKTKEAPDGLGFFLTCTQSSN